MTLEEIQNNIEDQERGRECRLVNPFDGSAAGIAFRIAGPDSRLAQKSRLELLDALAEAADVSGRVDSATREKLVLDSLAKLVLDMTAEEATGERVIVSHASIVRLLRVSWIREQADAFAGDRRNFRPEDRT